MDEEILQIRKVIISAVKICKSIILTNFSTQQIKLDGEEILFDGEEILSLL